MNDRQLREIVDGLGGRTQGVPREDGFEITVASEIMAILCLSKDILDLKDKVAAIIVGYTYDDKPVTVADLKIQGAVAAVLKDALKPNLHRRWSIHRHSSMADRSQISPMAAIPSWRPEWR